MHTASHTKSTLSLCVGILLCFVTTSLSLADGQVRFSTQNNLLTIPYAIIDEQQFVHDVEMQLQANGQFVLNKINPQPSLQIDFNQEFELRMDQIIWIKDTAYRLKLSGVIEDSRCPIETQCITVGTVSLLFSLYQGTTHFRDLPLSLGDHGSDSIEIGDARITVSGVMPQPSHITSLIPGDYAAKLIITDSNPDSAAALRRAPQQLPLDGVIFALDTYLWRDFMPIAEPEGSNLFSMVKLHTGNGGNIHIKPVLQAQYVIYGDAVWKTPFERVDFYTNSIEGLSNGGPKWGPDVLVDVVLELQYEGLTYRILAKNQAIIATH